MTKMISRIRLGVVLLEKDKLLVVQMQRSSGDIFVLPGGGLELGEGIFECAKREVKEEANVDIDILKILYLKDLCTDTEHALELVLLGKIIGGKIAKGFDPESKTESVLHAIKWVPLGELKELNFHPKQLKDLLPNDAKNDFTGTPNYLGKFQYPEK